MSRIATVRALLLLQMAIFVSAASMHFGLLFEGHRHRTQRAGSSLASGSVLPPGVDAPGSFRGARPTVAVEVRSQRAGQRDQGPVEVFR